MKRIVSLVLMLVMLLALSATGFAADGDESEATGPSATHDPVIIQKEYIVSGGDAIPSETLSFTVAADKTNPDTSTITVDPINTANPVDPDDPLAITINFPTYTKMGVYKYTLTEDAGTALGVTYDTTEVEVIVTVVNESAGGDNTEDKLKAYVAVFRPLETDDGEEDKEKIGGDKPESDSAAFQNEYALGKLTISKQVTGNLASNTKEFTIEVKFSGGANAASLITYSVADGEPATLKFGEDGTVSASITLKHGDSAVFSNIPAGVTYTVVEASKHTTGDLNSDEGYTATYKNSDNSTTTTGSGSITSEDEDTVEITNEKKTDIQTGISLDNMPYVLMIMVVIGMASYMVVRKRRFTED